MARAVEIVLRLLTGGFTDKARQASRDLGGVGAAARRVGGALAGAAARGLDRLAVAGTAAAGVGLGLAIRDYQELELRLARIGVTAGEDAGQVEQLRKALLDLSGQATGQLSKDLLTAAEALVTLGLSWEQATDPALLAALGRTATATGADIADLAGTVFQLQQAYGLTGRESARALETLAVAGKLGAFELRDMAAELPAIAAKMQAIGQVGPQGLVRTAAMLQIVRGRVGDTATAATNLSNVLDYIQGQEFLGKAKGEGFSPFDEQGRLRDLFEVIEDISRVTERGANTQALARMFSDKQAREGMTAILLDLDKLNELIGQIEGAGPVIDEDFARVSGTAAQQLKNLRAELERMAQTSLGPWFGQLTDMFRLLNDNPVLLDDLVKAGAVLTAGGLARRPLMGLYGALTGGATGGVAGAVKGGVAGATSTPVFVTNWPMGFGVGGVPAGGAGPGGAGPGVPRQLPAAATGLGMSIGAAGLGKSLGVAGIGLGTGLAIGTGANVTAEKLVGKSISDHWESIATTLASWLGSDASQRLREVRREERQQYREDKLKIELDITLDEDDRRKKLKETRDWYRGHRS